MALRRSPLEIAQQHEKKGNLAKAAEAYSEHLTHNAADPRVLLKFAEIHEKLGNAQPAADGFYRLGVIHAKDSIDAKATAMLRRALKLVPTHSASVNLLADVLVKGGKRRDALEALEVGSRAAASAGDVSSRLKLLKRAAELDEGVTSRLAFAQVLSETGKMNDAITVLRQSAERLGQHSELTLDRLMVLERWLHLAPTDTRVALETAQLAIKLHDERRALGSLRLGLDSDPESPDLISATAMALEGLGEDARALLVFREAARRLTRAGRTVEAKRSWISVLRYSPSDSEALVAVGPGYVAKQSRPKPPNPLVGIGASEMNAALSSLGEQQQPNQTSPTADHELEISLDDLDDKLTIEFETTQT